MQAQVRDLPLTRTRPHKPTPRLPRLPRPVDSRNTVGSLSAEISSSRFIYGMVFAIAALTAVWLGIAILALAGL